MINLYKISLRKAYSLTRLPMRNVCAPEIVNTIAAVVAGERWQHN